MIKDQCNEMHNEFLIVITGMKESRTVSAMQYKIIHFSALFEKFMQKKEEEKLMATVDDETV